MRALMHVRAKTSKASVFLLKRIKSVYRQLSDSSQGIDIGHLFMYNVFLIEINTRHLFVAFVEIAHKIEQQQSVYGLCNDHIPAQLRHVLPVK